MERDGGVELGFRIKRRRLLVQHEPVEQWRVALRDSQKLGVEPDVQLLAKGEHAAGETDDDEKESHRKLGPAVDEDEEMPYHWRDLSLQAQ